MGPVSFLCAVFLLLFCPEQGSSAVTPLFVEKGSDVILKVPEADIPATFILLIWKFNNSDILVTFGPNKEPEFADEYSGRIDVNNFSLTLKNLQEADSGVYIARLTGKTKENTLAGYNVTVQDPVSPVELTVDNVSKGAEMCVVTVTCSTLDSRHINASFRCDTKTCSQEDGGLRSVVTTSGASLRLYLSNNVTISCNHSNQVSLKRNMTSIAPFCSSHADSEASKLYIAVSFVVATVTIATIFTVVYVCHKKRRKSHTFAAQNKDERETLENTVYAFAQARTVTEEPAETGHDKGSSVYDQVHYLARS